MAGTLASKMVCQTRALRFPHSEGSLQAAVRIVGDWANGGSYEVLAYGREANLPARDYLDDSWMPAFFAQLAKENGLSLTLTHEP